MIYIGLFELICKVFVKVNGVKFVLFSVNFEGVCFFCKGVGVIIMEFGFMDMIEIFCEDCGGK